MQLSQSGSFGADSGLSVFKPICWKADSLQATAFHENRQSRVTMRPCSPSGPQVIDSCSDTATVIARPAVPAPRQLMRDFQVFRDPKPARSLWELGITLIPFLGLFAAIIVALDAGHLLALALTPLQGLFLLRLFIIQHDCGHGSFLRSRASNDWFGRMLGVFTLTPYDCWSLSHARHHAMTGNLDKRGFGDVDTLTVREYSQKSWTKRLGYRLYRHPLILLGFGPAYLFLLRHRLPVGLMKEGGKFWISAMGTNLITLTILAVPVWSVGVGVTLAVFLPTLLFAASMGVWLFYIQHQFPQAYWQSKPDWSFADAALLGSTYLDLPPILRWFTGNIGIHHVHHLSSTIPFYRLPEVLKAHPALRDLNRYTAWKSLSAFRLALWDEGQQRMVTFAEAKELAG